MAPWLDGCMHVVLPLQVGHRPNQSSKEFLTPGLQPSEDELGEITRKTVQAGGRLFLPRVHLVPRRGPLVNRVWSHGELALEDAVWCTPTNRLVGVPPVPHELPCSGERRSRFSPHVSSLLLFVPSLPRTRAARHALGSHVAKPSTCLAQLVPPPQTPWLNQPYYLEIKDGQSRLGRGLALFSAAPQKPGC